MTDSATEKPDKPEPVQRLGDALWGPVETDISHDECRAALPQFVEAQVAGEDAAAQFPRVQRHLDHCEDCGEEYALLVDLELAEQGGELGVEGGLPAPAFTYQEARSPELNRIVVEWARALVAFLAPASAGDLDRAADRFFATLKPRQANETRAAYGAALGIDQEPGDEAFTLLALTFATTQELTEQVSRQEFEDWRAQDRLGAELETRADACAREMGLDAARARDFANAYAQVAAQEANTWRNLLD